MKIDREEGTCFNLRFVYVFISHSANKEDLYTLCKTLVKSRLNNCGFNSQELAISRP